MFKRLTDFNYQRNWKEAIGFYLSYFLLGIILGAACGFVWGTITLPADATFSSGFDAGINLGEIVSVVYCSVITLILLVQRKLYRSFMYLVLALCVVPLAILGGGLLGLIIPAYMTTRNLPTSSPTT